MSVGHRAIDIFGQPKDGSELQVLEPVSCRTSDDEARIPWIRPDGTTFATDVTGSRQY